VPEINPEPPVAPAPPKAARLDSLDVFRGITIAGMLLVNNPGSWGHIYTPLEHSGWNGWTPTDLVFPFFLFIMGVAVPFSFAKRRATESKKELFLHVLARGLSLFLLGEFGYAIPGIPDPVAGGSFLLTLAHILGVAFLAVGFVVLLYPWKSRRKSLLIPPITAVAFVAVLLLIQLINHHALSAGVVPADYGFGGGIFAPDHLRIPGVLQRIGVCYVVAASLYLLCPAWPVLVLAAVALMAVYSVVMLKTPYPSLADPSQMVHGLLGPKDNLARYVDTTVLGTKEHPTFFGVHAYASYPDPEGIVSTLPAIGTALLGILAGLWLRTGRPLAERCAGLLAAGVMTALLGWVLDSALMPINKQLWTPSFTVFCAGMGMLGLGTSFYLIDVRNLRWPFAAFKAYGMNAITAFVLAGILGRLSLNIRWHADPDHPDKLVALKTFLADHAARLAAPIPFGDPASNASVAYALCYVAAFGVVMYVLYKCKVFLKV
jgi:predicted acyltransferase